MVQEDDGYRDIRLLADMTAEVRAVIEGTKRPSLSLWVAWMRVMTRFTELAVGEGASGASDV